MKSLLATAAIFLWAFSSAASLAADWGRFRGPNGSGIDRSSELPAKWTEDHVQWQVELPGSGHGSPIVWGEHIYLLAAVAEPAPRPDDSDAAAGKKGKKQKKKQPAVPHTWQAIAISREDGSVAWAQKFPSQAFKGHRFNSAASSTPAADADRVIFTWGTAEALTVVSLSHQGELQWQRELDGVKGGHGYGSSPILHDGLVVLNNDQDAENGNLFALHADSGETAWRVPRRSQRLSYSVPCVYQDTLVFVNWQHGITALDPASGDVIDEISVFNTKTNERAISSPTVAGDLLIGTCGFTANPKHCVAMRLADGKWQEAWRIEKNVPHIPCVLAIDELVFLWDDSGILTCVDRVSGEEHWKARLPHVRGTFYSSPVSDGRHIFCPDESGLVHVIAATDRFEYIANYDLEETCKTTPAIADGVLYIRSASSLRAIHQH